MNNAPELLDWAEAIMSGLRPLRAKALDDRQLTDKELERLGMTLSAVFHNWKAPPEPEKDQPSEWQKYVVYLDCRWTNSGYTAREESDAIALARKYRPQFENLSAPSFLKHLLLDVSRKCRDKQQSARLTRSPVAKDVRRRRKALAARVMRCVRDSERELLSVTSESVRQPGSEFLLSPTAPEWEPVRADTEVRRAIAHPPETVDDFASSIEALTNKRPLSEPTADELLRRLKLDERFRPDPSGEHPGIWTFGMSAPYLGSALQSLAGMKELARLLEGPGPLPPGRKTEDWHYFARCVGLELREAGINAEGRKLETLVRKLVSLAFRRPVPSVVSMREVMK